MPPDDPIDTALASLIDIMRAYKEGAWKDKEGLRAILKSLYTGGDKEPFVTFWRSATNAEPNEILAVSFGRFQTMRSAYARIARLHGRDYW